MLDAVFSFLSWPFIAAGSFFLLVGALGLVRMPDIYTRMHAASVLETLGAGLLLVGMMFEAGLTLVTVKLLIILAIIIFTSPVATHALAQAALHDGVVPVLDSKKVLGMPPDEAATRLDFETVPQGADKAGTKRRPPKRRSKRKGGASSKPS